MKKLEDLLEKRNSEIEADAKARKLAEDARVKNNGKVVLRSVIGGALSIPIGWFIGSICIAIMAVRGCFKKGPELQEFNRHLDQDLAPYFQNGGRIILLLIIIFYAWTNYINKK